MTITEYFSDHANALIYAVQLQWAGHHGIVQQCDAGYLVHWHCDKLPA